MAHLSPANKFAGYNRKVGLRRLETNLRRHVLQLQHAVLTAVRCNMPLSNYDRSAIQIIRLSRSPFIAAPRQRSNQRSISATSP